MAELRQYDPKRVTITIGSSILSGFADGSFVTVAFNEDAWTLQMGTDGEGTRSKSNNYSGRVTVMLMQSSPSNAYLSKLAIDDRLRNEGAAPLLIKDANGETLFSSEAVWVIKMPDSDYSREASAREWLMETHELKAEFSGYDGPVIQN